MSLHMLSIDRYTANLPPDECKIENVQFAMLQTQLLAARFQ